MNILHSEIKKDLLASSGTDMRDVLEFMRDHSVSMTPDQVQGCGLLMSLNDEFNDFSDLVQLVVSSRPLMTSDKKYFETISKITLGDRIKGSAKLGSLLKSSVNVPKPSDGELR